VYEPVYDWYLSLFYIAARAWRLFGTRRLIETRHLLEHSLQNPGVYTAKKWK